MPIWNKILDEIVQSPYEDEVSKFTQVRRKYMYLLHKNTGNSVILYASAWLQNYKNVANISIDDRDIQAFMEVSHGLGNTNLDLILHSPGGSIGATESLVSYLRSRFQKIRVIVPNLAMSAATMIACAADQIILGKHSFLGPTDSQVPIATQQGMKLVPAQAILDEFDRAKLECKDRKVCHAWMPILDKYHPGLLQELRQVQELSAELVKNWLASYMFDGNSDNEDDAKRIAEWFSDHQRFRIHDRRISRKDLKELRMNIMDLEDDPELQDLSLSVFHATTLLFEATDISKIVENHAGRAYIS